MPFFYSKKLSSQKNLTHGFTKKDVGADYECMASVLGVDVSQIYYLEQIHSNKVVSIAAGSRAFPNLESMHHEEGDSLITNVPGVLVGVRTADCVPLLVFDPVQRAVAAIHAGHKGLSGGVIHNTFLELKKYYGTNAKDCLVSIGPSISVENYEVNEELITHYKEVLPNEVVYVKKTTGKQTKGLFLNLQSTATNVLKKLGVPQNQIEDLRQCTYADPELFYSYRRFTHENPGIKDGLAGRQFSFIGLTE